jgi:hypothetical protein
MSIVCPKTSLIGRSTTHVLTTVFRLIVLSLFPALLIAQSSVEFTGRYWMPQLGSRIRVESNGFGTDIEGARDLGIPNTNFPSGGFAWQHGRSRLRFEYTPIEYSGDQNVTRTVFFGGRQYTVGTRVVSDLEVRHMELGWSYQFIDVGEGKFRLGPMTELNGFLMRGTLAAPDLATPFHQSEDLKAGLPTVGLAMDIQPYRSVDIYGQVSGMKAGSYGHFVSGDSGVKVRWRHLLWTGGYRTFNLHVNTSQDFAHFRLRGPFVGAGFRF